jgi:hypothetical protein
VRAGHDRRGHRRVTGLPAALVAVAVGALAVLGLAPSAARADLTWHGPFAGDPGGQGSAIVAVSCPSGATCVAVTAGGGAVVFDPRAPASATPATIDTVPPTGLACPGTSRCVSVDGSGNLVTFDPMAPSSPSSDPIDAGHSLTGVACVPGGARCVAVDASGNALAFDPAAPGTPTADPLESGIRLTAVACPDQTVCVAIDSADRELTFDPQAVAGPSSVQTVDATAHQLTALACPTATQCLAFDNAGQQMSTNPQAPSAPTTTLLDPGSPITAAACSDAGHCDAIDAAGNVLSFAPGQSGAATAVDPGGTLAGIACPTVCVAGDTTGHIHTFAPQGTGGATILIDAQAAYSAVACPAVSQCTAMDNFGDEATFDPGGSGSAGAASVDADADVVYGIACPSATQCTAVDDLGAAATFDPQSPAGATVTSIVTGHPLLAVACPSLTQCTAVDDDRYAATFDPQRPATAQYTDLQTPAVASILGIACPSATQCTALDGAGDAVTFNPQSPGPRAPVRVLPGPGVAIACPTAAVCIAVDADGDRATFEPSAPAGRTTASISTSQPVALSCPSATYCVAVDTNGTALEFDPHAAALTVARSVGTGVGAAGLNCPSIGRCVVVDFAGTAFTGTQTIPGVPAAITAPRITGHLEQGDLLTARQGTWRNTPTSYSAQWERCTAAGRSCHAITGATALTHRAVSADVGHALRIVEMGANPLGTGAAATSRATHAVAGLPAGPRVSGAALIDPRHGAPRLRLALTAARYGPTLKRISVRLPSGVTVRAHGPPGAAVLAVAGGRRVRGDVRPVRGGFVINLRHPTPRLHVALAAPRLAVNRRALVARLRRRGVRRLTVAVAVGARRSERTTAPLAVAR